jgi:PAS domain S-box-containing protein
VLSRTTDRLLPAGLALAGLAAAGVAARDTVRPGLDLPLATMVAVGAASLAFLLVRAARRSPADDTELAAARDLLSAIPEGLVVVRDGRIVSVNRRLCELVGFDREELIGRVPPYPFWPPEHRHELERWHATLEQRGELDGELTFIRRDGERLHAAVAARRVAGDDDAARHVLAVHDVSTSRRRELRLAELCGRDPQTGVLDHREFEVRLGAAVRHAIAHNEPLCIVLIELSLRGRTGKAVLGRPEALVAVEQLREIIRADDVLARTGECELALILPDTDAHGGVGAVARARTALAPLEGLALTAGACDLATARDAMALCAFADRALVEARKQGLGGTSTYSVPRAA